jgi:hypothetical protein
MNMYGDFSADLNQLLGDHIAVRITVDSYLVRCDQIFGDLGMIPERETHRGVSPRTRP